VYFTDVPIINKESGRVLPDSRDVVGDEAHKPPNYAGTPPALYKVQGASDCSSKRGL